MPYVDVDGGKLYYEDVGEGRPFLLLPGALGTARSDFGPQLEGLPGRGIRIIAPDPQGYGKSRPPERTFPVDFYQRDANGFASLMHTLGIREYSVGGWSDGAITSLLLTLSQPLRVQKMAIWGGNSYVSQEDVDSYEKTRDVADWSPKAAEPMKIMYAAGFQSIWSRWCDAQQHIFKTGGDLCKSRLGMIKCPTFLIHGAKDPLVPLFHAEFLKQGIAGARLHLFPEGRHNIHLFYAKEFNEMLVEFLLA